MADPVTSWSIAHSWLTLALPLAAFLINGVALGRRAPRAAAALAVCANFCAAVVAVLVARDYFSAATPTPLLAWSFPWMELPHFAGGLTLGIGCWLDPIAVMMLVLITVISTLVHIYAAGYLRGDPGFGRFFALLPFFSFAMTGLVIAPDLIQLYIFWELVGLASYLLIGFWFTKPTAVAASKKAFIITRFADAFFLIGIVLIATALGTVQFAAVNAPAAGAALAAQPVAFGGHSCSLLALAAVLLFAGGWGKSAMFPLHVWLPDAMEGPTPVSSIIHSATMVVAGVFLTARLFPLFAAAGSALFLAETLGAFTALLAALMACVQTDIKRVLAYSTLSQLGYMMFALGVADSAAPAGYTASMFHVFTHAFFKCMLFLCAGIVIHAAHTNDLLGMGGLRRKLPLTHAATLLGCLALAGIWPLSGFFSKDAILASAWTAGRPWIFAVGLATSLLTAFYMARLYLLAFAGASRAQGRDAHAHEDWLMALPVAVLALPSAAAGWLAEKFFAQHMLPPGMHAAEHAAHAPWVPWLALGAAVSGLLFAFFRYGRGFIPGAPKNPAVRLAFNRFYVDELWQVFAHWLMFTLVAAPAKWFDNVVIDGSLDASAWLMQKLGAAQRAWQNGLVQRYLAAMLVGLLALYVLGVLAK